VNAVALNYRDKMVIEGNMPISRSFPFTPASDMAGVVDSTGEGVTRFKPGARVISSFFPEWIDGKPKADARHLPYRTLGGYFQGMLAEYVIMNENWLVAAPETLDDAEASTLPCAGLTAWFALVERGNLRAGQSVLVQGRAVWRYSRCKSLKRMVRKCLSRPAVMKNWRRPKSLGPIRALTG
jgi:NADPH:quinone reductase-like Zn-dependent oxidoreductase